MQQPRDMIFSPSSPIGEIHRSASQLQFSPTFPNPHYPSFLNPYYPSYLNSYLPLHPSLLGYGHRLLQDQDSSLTIDAILRRRRTTQYTGGSPGPREKPIDLTTRPGIPRDGERDGAYNSHPLPSPSAISFPHMYGADHEGRLIDQKSANGIGNCNRTQSKGKRMRTIFTRGQLEKLEVEFERHHYIVGAERYDLSASLNLTEAQIKVWFQNRRIKDRKQNLKQQHAKLGPSSKEGKNCGSGSESEANRRKMSGYIDSHDDSYFNYLPHPLEICDQRRGGSGSCAGGGSARTSISSQVDEDSVHGSPGIEGHNDS